MTKPEIKKLDDLWSKVVKDKAAHACEHCKIQGIRMEAAHVVGRRHRATRWGYYATFQHTHLAITIKTYDLCGHCLCHNCHQAYDEHGPLEKDIVEKTIGLDRKHRIQQYAWNTVAKHQDFDEIKKVLEAL